MTGRDLVASAAIIDTLVFADGRAEAEICGGAGLYASAGAALFSDDVLLVTGTGADYVDSFGPWMARNGLSTDGLRIADPHAPRNLLRYIDETTRTETPVYGMEHFARIEPRVDDLAPLLGDARSLYVFRNVEPAFWDGLIPRIKGRDFPLLWEIALDACRPEDLRRIERLLCHVDAISLNIEEAAAIFDITDERELISHLARWPVDVFLRAGSLGSHVITGGASHFIPSLAVDVVDVTGGGNAYSGAAATGLGQGQGAVQAGVMGTVAASIAIAQLGLPEPAEAATRMRARAGVAGLADKVRKEAFA